MTAETILNLANYSKNIVGVKEASGNLPQIMHIIKDAPSHFQVISGDDALALPMVLLGGAGVISVLANSQPDLVSAMIRSALKGDLVSARKLHYGLLDMMDALFAEGSPAGVKAALKHLGICEDVVRLPLVSASDKLSQHIAKLLKN